MILVDTIATLEGQFETGLVEVVPEGGVLEGGLNRFFVEVVPRKGGEGNIIFVEIGPDGARERVRKNPITGGGNKSVSHSIIVSSSSIIVFLPFFLQPHEVILDLLFEFLDRFPVDITFELNNRRDFFLHDLAVLPQQV